ncbi:MAG: lycopene cyclase family protein [Acidobacteriota bacterium]
MNRDPIVIGGGGCAGLSLAVHLLEAGVDDRPIILIEPRTDYVRDRTWCLWALEPHPFSACVRHRWHRWRVAAPIANGETIASSAAYAYEHIPADVFYDEALARLRAAPNVTLRLGERVLDVDAGAQHVDVRTDSDDVLRADLFFDSRPPTPTPGALLQHFRGWFVRADAPVFDPTTATLMDFQPTDDPSEIRFAYLLPFSAREALVEMTCISTRPHASAVYDAAIRAYLDRAYGLRDVTVTGEESGVIPMTLGLGARARRQRRQQPGRAVPIGTPAGCVRASSGYAFLAIQRTSAHLARAVRAGVPPTPPRAWRRRARFLDRVFLSFLRHRPERAPAMFAAMFRRVPADHLVRFLADSDTPRDLLDVIWAMPKADFTREWLRTLRHTAPA